MPCCKTHGVFMVNGMANRETSELGGQGVAVKLIVELCFTFLS